MIGYMKRRGFFAALLGAAPVAAVAAQAKTTSPNLMRWNIKRFDCGVPCDCENCGGPCLSGGFDAKWEVIDRSTNVSRLFCDKCVEEFISRPVPFLIPHAPTYSYRAAYRSRFAEGPYFPGKIIEVDEVSDLCIYCGADRNERHWRRGPVKCVYCRTAYANVESGKAFFGKPYLRSA